MKIVIKTFVFALMISISSLNSAEITSEQSNQLFNESIANAFTLIYEEASGIPASSIGTMAGQLSTGDYAGGIMTAADIATDTALSMIPGVGTLKFVIGLEQAVINVGKSFLDEYMLNIAWNKFKVLSNSDQDAWVNGEYLAEMDAALGDYYTSRNVADIRSLFKVYIEKERSKQATMDRAASIITDLNKAKYFLPAEVYTPYEGTDVTYSDNIKLEWWAYDANYFKVVVMVDGGTYSQIVKVDPYQRIPSIKLSEFGIDWNTIFANAIEPVQVTWYVESARYDSTGVLEAVYGADVVIESSKLIRLDGYDPVKQSTTYAFVLHPEIVPLIVKIRSPSDGTETADNQVTVNAELSTESNYPLPEITHVGIVVNGEIQYSTLDSNSFSSVAVLKTGDNSIKAGARTSDGSVYFSDSISVNSSALNNRYHIRITWDKDDTDVDLHFSWDQGEECYYGNSNPQWGDSATSPALDVDNTSGFGPENITIDSLPGSGNYSIWAHYFSDHDNGGTTVKATISENGVPIYSGTRYLTNDATWTLYDFTIP